MGREIVYCWKCAKRIDGGDFRTRKAYRYGDKSSCDECVYELVAELSAEEQEAILQGPPADDKGSSSANKPVHSATTRATRKTGPIPTAKTTTRITGVRKAVTQKVPPADPRGGTGQRRAVTRSIPKEPPPGEEAVEASEEDPAARKKKTLVLIGAGGGGLLLVVVVLLIVLLGGKKKAPPTEQPPADAPLATKKDPRKEKEEAARKAYQDAVLLINDKPDDLAAQMAALRDVEKAAADLPDLREQVLTQLEILTTAKIPTEVRKVEEEAWGFLKPREFQPKKALEYVDTALTRHEIPEWKQAVEGSREKVKARIQEFFKNQKRQAVENKEAGIDAKVKEVVDLVSAWEMPEYLEELKTELAKVALPATAAPADPSVPATAAAPDASKPKTPKRELKPLPEPVKAYLPVLQRAMGHVAIRDFDSGLAEIRKMLRELEGDAKAAANEDVETLEMAKGWMEEAGKILSGIRRLEKLTLEYQDRPGQWKTVEGRATFVNDQRVELSVVEEKDGKKTQKTVYVEWLALSGKSLGEQIKRLRKGGDGKNDALAATLLALAEGDAEGAEAQGGRPADRFWHVAPGAKERISRSSREFEARILFHQAQQEYASMDTRGAALEKYKTLQNDYATTQIVRSNLSTMLARASEGKEYVFTVHDMGKNGVFMKKPELHLETEKDVDISEARDNYVEATFYALPGAAYRCWVYVGACCKETFTFYYQASEGTTKNAGKDVSLDPGGNMAAPVVNQISGLKKDHAAHKPRDPKDPHPKTPARWEWIPIPFPKQYEAHGAKSVRLLTDQGGFAVKYIVISSVRSRTPDDKDLAEFQKAAENPPTADTGPKGAKEPKDWIVVGPFKENLTQAAPPEQEIDLLKEMKGNSGPVKWKTATADLRGGRAFFDWDKNKLFNPKDNVSAYAVIHVKSPETRDAQLMVSHDDGGRVWLNGELVHSNNKGALKDDEFKKTVRLEEGWNRVLVKVRNGGGAFGFVLRFADKDGKAIEGLEYHAYGDQLVPP